MSTLRARRASQGEPLVYASVCHKMPMTDRQRDRDRAEAVRALTGGQLTLYACRLADDTIKIGCTRELDKRRKKFGPGTEILGFMPGDYDDEQAIHASLVAHRAHGHEYYHPTPQVLDVVNEMRDHFGLPHLTR